VFMAIYELEKTKTKITKITKVEASTFSALGLKEREDIQRLLRVQIDVIASDIMVIAEEFNEWEGSQRSIDLLAVDKNANLVVIELKRTEDGGHMELQSIRYAAMVSNLTFKRAVEIFGRYLKKPAENAEKMLLLFFGWEEVNEENFASQTRIILASANFSKEITSAVLWLNSQGLDISCVRMKPYLDGERILLDVQTIIPLPEAEQFQIKVREKKLQEQLSKSHTLKNNTKYIVSINNQSSEPLPKRMAMYKFVEYLIEKGYSPFDISEACEKNYNSFFFKVDGRVCSKDFKYEIMLSKEEGITQNYKRFFVADAELFIVDGDTYAVTNQWKGSFLPTVNSLLENLAIKGVSIDPFGCEN
jgi:hypothetical protein